MHWPILDTLMRYMFHCSIGWLLFLASDHNDVFFSGHIYYGYYHYHPSLDAVTVVLFDAAINAIIIIVFTFDGCDELSILACFFFSLHSNESIRFTPKLIWEYISIEFLYTSSYVSNVFFFIKYFMWWIHIFFFHSLSLSFLPFFCSCDS